MTLCLGRSRQKQAVEDDGEPDAVSESYPEPKSSSNDKFRRGDLFRDRLRVSDNEANDESEDADHKNAGQPHSKKHRDCYHGNPQIGMTVGELVKQKGGANRDGKSD